MTPNAPRARALRYSRGGRRAQQSRARTIDGVKLSVRVGIDTGTVVIGKGGGSESEVFGDAANIASRVQSAADPDMVIVNPAG